MIDKITSCAFTGHRPKTFSFGYDESSPEFAELYSKIKNLIIQVCNHGCRTFLCGMAEGVDLWCAEIVLELKDQFSPPLSICAVVPYLTQPAPMTAKNKERYRKIMELSKARFLVSRRYSKFCFQKRNRFLVDNSDAVIAVLKPGEEHSGTAQTIRYARRKKKKIWIISA